MSEKKPLYATSQVSIKAGKVWKNGELFLDASEKNTSDFLRAFYDSLGVSYPKFFKMDNLCKLGWLAAEMLQQNTGFVENYQAEEKGIILANRSSSLDTDIRHQESIAREDAYFPSPAVFVYTLSNIVAGEICIRQKIKGSSAFFIFDAFDSELLFNQASIQLHSGRVKACIVGMVEWLENQYEACLFLVEKDSAAQTKKELTNIYIQNAYTIA